MAISGAATFRVLCVGMVSLLSEGQASSRTYPTPFHQNDPRDEAVTVRGETGTARFVVTGRKAEQSRSAPSL